MLVWRECKLKQLKANEDNLKRDHDEWETKNNFVRWTEQTGEPAPDFRDESDE